MMRRFTLLAAGAVLGAVVMGGVAQFGGIGGATAAATDTYRQLNLFGDVFERIRSDYVEEPDDAKLIEAAINGMLSSLDPHSSYLNAKDYQDMQVQTRGEFFGLGIEVTMENEVIKVISPIDDTPAFKAGILAGDLITAARRRRRARADAARCGGEDARAGEFVDHADRRARRAWRSR